MKVRLFVHSSERSEQVEHPGAQASQLFGAIQPSVTKQSFLQKFPTKVCPVGQPSHWLGSDEHVLQLLEHDEHPTPS